MTVVFDDSLASPGNGGDEMSEPKTLICANPDCNIEFVPKTHNNKFHSDECCRLETNRKIMEKYYERKRQRAGEVRYCIQCETTRLSRYNNSSVCGACRKKKEEQQNHSVIAMLENTSIAL